MALILVVDDSESVRKEVSEFFIKNNIKVITAEDGMVAIDLLESNPDVKVILIDIHMPTMDGTTMVETLRREFQADRFEIFIITSEVSLALKKWGQENKVKGFLMKPFNGPAILPLMKQLLQLTEDSPDQHI